MQLEQTDRRNHRFRYLRYALLYHDRLIFPVLLLGALLLLPVYFSGLVALFIQCLANAILSAVLMAIHHRRTGNNAVFFLNMNLELWRLQATFLLLDMVAFLLLSCLILFLR
ncbi:hypothetical protein CLV84_0025 [Neolewinella xylanilytica]|uniref:Uncharacterized protein n=1 Tax=Neolewinella xylanilytica TaxID=1514080 RepID=A0A2S6I6G0_9BACT|nr:hypothetical protein [Neolewinella xylanilytica]PPK87091.1 hypothetical protein CLV84_0025 [Neolewinella xylanilytica]